MITSKKLTIFLAVPALLSFLILIFLQMNRILLDVSAEAQIVEFIVDLINLSLSYFIFKHSKGGIANLCFVIAVAFLFFVDISYFFVYSIPKQAELLVLFNAIHFIFYISSICFFITAIARVFTLKQMSAILFFIAVLSVAIFEVFSVSAHKFYLSNYIQIAQSYFELFIFGLAFIYLLYAKRLGSALIASGYIIIMSSEFFLTSCYITNFKHLLVFSELGWLFGLIIIMIGLAVIIDVKKYSSQKWLSYRKTIKTTTAKLLMLIFIIYISCFFVLLKKIEIINDIFYIFFPSTIMLTSLVVTILSVLLARSIDRPLSQINHALKAFLSVDYNPNKFLIENPHNYTEIKNVEKNIHKLFYHIEKKAKHAAIGSMALQVAHDIRSPLSSIQTFVEQVKGKLPESDRIFLRGVARRIDDIAYNLVNTYKGREKEHGEYLFLGICIADIVAEKRQEYLNKKDIDFEFELSKENSFALAKVDAVEFSRVLSNLINNAANAIEKNGKIIIHLESNYLGHCITIQDNGIGMPKEKVEALLSETSTNESGIGLGVSHAKTFLKSIGGDLDIESEESKGSSVFISLPSSEPPKWLISNCNIKDELVIVVDDDPSIHEVWDRKVKEIEGLELRHYFTPESLLEDISIFESKSIIVFSDYEFLNSDKNGLDLLTQIKIDCLKVLVTSHFDELDIIESCVSNTIKLLPKTLAPYFVIEKACLKIPGDVSLIFIDDDKHSRDSWRFFAKQDGVNIADFERPDEFLAVVDLFEKSTPVYIDLDLQLEKNGVEYGKEIFEKGFHTIYLATGSECFDVSSFPWIKGVVKKKFPYV